MKKILVLEDEENIRSFVVINLKRAGYETVEAGTGEEALARGRAQAEAEVAGYMKQAEEKAAQRSAQIVEQTKGACGDLRKAAERRMAEASALIVGRVVKV